MGARKICVVTATRAEYGLLAPLLDAAAEVPELDLQLVVTGTHLSPRFGQTIDAIRSDGRAITATVDILCEGDDEQAAADTSAKAISTFTRLFQSLRPDLVVLLGDRYETLAVGMAALLTRLPIAHIHGGELTEGAFDDAIRHALSKMAHLHFTAAEPYRRRLLQMGEAPERVFTVGALGLDNIRRLNALSWDDLVASLGIALARPVFLITYHPATLSKDAAAGAVALIEALGHFPEATMIFTGVNADPGHDQVETVIRKFAANRPQGKVVLAASLGQQRYLSAMKHADVVIGNSSSGLIEAPMFGVPTVNLGNRQAGRLRAATVIDCEETAAAIEAAIRQALANGRADTIKPTPLGERHAAERIVRVLTECDLKGILGKRFHDQSQAIPDASQVTVIAEVGVNHNGDIAKAEALIDAAVDAGADIVKFQTFRADALTTAAAAKAGYQRERTSPGASQREMLRALELDQTAYYHLMGYCRTRGIEFMSTPFDLESLAFLADDLGVRRIKVGSGDLTNAPMLLAIARRGLPVLLSTGMAVMDEIEQALGILAFGYTGRSETPDGPAFLAAGSSPAGRHALAANVTLLQCTTAYPAAAEELNLRVMDHLAERFSLRVGFSDHSQGMAAAIAAVGRGAAVIEKHITLDRALPGPDHAASMEPDTFKALVDAVRETEAALGSREKVPSATEQANMAAARKSLVAAKAIAKDEVLTSENMTVKRPGTGIPASEYYSWLGRRASRDFAPDDMIA